MKIKRITKDNSKRIEIESARTSRQMKFLFSLNNRTTTRGPYRKPARYTGQFVKEHILVQSTIHVHTKSGKAVRNLSYIVRDAAMENGRENEQHVINRHSIADWDNDRFHYMLVVNQRSENKLKLDDFARQLAYEIERDLDTPIDWIAAVHRNTDNPHIHLMIRGKDGYGNDLEIRTQYLHRVVPQIASEIATINIRQHERALERGMKRERETINRTYSGRDL